jgi:hypothetical protein
MSAVIEREHDLYTTVGDALGDRYVEYSPGSGYVPMFLDMAGIERGTESRYSLLDAGCCSGKGALALYGAGFRNVHLCDLTGQMRVPEVVDFPFFETCLWHSFTTKHSYVHGGKYDYVFCCDVLEHIPTEYTMLTIARLAEVAKRGVFLSISLVQDGFGVMVGEHLHKTVQPFAWWRDAIAALGLGRVKECRDLLHTGLYYLETRPHVE